jgi:SdrD B-like domain/Secretion system C-terminal sorting domain
MRMLFIHLIKAKKLFLAVLILLLINISSRGEVCKECVCSKYYSTATVGNHVWLDKDGDGLQEIGEPGIEGVVVVLNDQSGNSISTTITDASGNYLFAGLDAGASGKNYQVWFKLPTGYWFSPKSGLIGDAGNSDADALTGRTGIFTVVPGEINNNIDAGFISPVIGTLPLHRLELTAVLKGATVDLNWVAENEFNTSQFVIQRSIDGVNYNNVGYKTVTGPTNIPTAYDYITDIHSLLSYTVIYYRIKAEDNAGRYAYSNVAPIRLSRLTGIKTWPNPFVSDIRITYNCTTNTKLDIELADNTGRKIWSGSFEVSRGLNQLSINGAEKFPAGIYFVKVIDNNTGQSFLEKLVK